MDAPAVLAPAVPQHVFSKETVKYRISIEFMSLSRILFESVELMQSITVF